MNRKVIKVVSALLMLLMVVTMFATPTLASWDNIDTNMFNEFKDDSGATTSAKSIVGAIISIVQVIGMGVAIIMLIVMAIKYISAAPSEKAEIKKGATIYIVGAIILFAASGILGIIKNFASANIKESSQSGAVEVVDMETVDTYLG